MKQYLQELQHELAGLVMDNPEALRYFSTDGSIFTMEPKAIVYPKHTGDVQATVRFVAERAAEGKNLSVIARGKGTDQGGGAVGDGLMLVFPAHMNKLIRIEKNSITVQPGLLYSSMQKILHSHGRFMPPYPASIDFCSIGGAVANNSCGEKTVKYGATRDYVQKLKVVLSDGSLIETKRISAKELARKKKLTSLEGEIYRKIDQLITRNEEAIDKASPHTSKNAAGYAIWDVKRPDGSFDLSQLIVGSQGTIGIVTEVTLKTLPYQPRTHLVVGYFNDLKQASEAVLKLQKLKPSALELVDYHLLEFLQKNKPGMLDGLIPAELPAITFLIEFDDASQLRQNIKSRQAQRIVKKYGYDMRVSTKPAEQARLWKIRRSAAAVIWMSQGKQKAVPIIEDGVVPVEKMEEFLNKTYKLLKKYKLDIAVWGHAGDANFHLQPFMDLSKKADRQKALDLADEFYDMVIKMGGSTCAEHNDGLMRSRYLRQLYGDKVYGIFKDIRDIFDPHDILNPGKKTDMTREEVHNLIWEERHEYSMKHLYDHMPHN
jgi:FAD/FMN-containing dehydrogenase